MDLITTKSVLLKTHRRGLDQGYRPAAIALRSPPGIGKTEATFQYAEELCIALQRPVALVQFMLATVLSPDVRGFMMPIKDPDGGLPMSVFSRPPWFPVKVNIYVIEPTGTGTVNWYSEG